MQAKNMRRLIALGLLLASVSGHAEKNTASLTLQYLPSNSTYESGIGLGIYYYPIERTGLYFNFQISRSDINGSSQYFESLNRNSFGDPVVGEIAELSLFNIGLTKRLGKYLSIYGGAGYADQVGFVEKFDPLGILGGGTYYVSGSSLDDSGLNLNAGLIIRIKALAIEGGYHSFAKASYLGLGFSY